MDAREMAMAEAEINYQAVEQLKLALDQLQAQRDEQAKLYRMYEESEVEEPRAMACAAGMMGGLDEAIKRISNILTTRLAAKSPHGSY
jgi:hypothetical protein